MALDAFAVDLGNQRDNEVALSPQRVDEVGFLLAPERLGNDRANRRRVARALVADMHGER
jgi:hypothetical protein